MIRRRTSGFTLLEMLTVIVIILMLMGIMLPMINKAYRNARVQEARKVAHEMKTAVEAYSAEYGRLPGVNHSSDQVPMTQDARRRMIQSLGMTTNALHSNFPNPKGYRFLSAKDMPTTGQLLDPWGSEYIVYLDTSYDGQIDLSGSLGTHRASAIVRSWGPNRKADNDPDAKEFDDIFTVTFDN